MWKGFMPLWLVLAVKYDDDGDEENYLWRALLKLEIVQHWFSPIYEYIWLLNFKAARNWWLAVLDNLIKWLANEIKYWFYLFLMMKKELLKIWNCFVLIEKSIQNHNPAERMDVKGRSRFSVWILF